jgi:hypothetical protein
LTDDQRKELRRREILTYRRKNSPTPSSQPDTPLPPAEKVAPPPPPPVCELLPKTTPTVDIQLNIDVANMFGKLNMTVPMTEMCKITSIKREVFENITCGNQERRSSHHFEHHVSRSAKGQEPSFLSFIRCEWPLLEQQHA